jgi:hypothetical protein
MKYFLFIIVAIVTGVFLLDIIGSGAGFTIPPAAAGSREGNIKKIKKYEYLDLFEKAKPTSKLAVKDHYTVIEGYIDTCSICKKLESKFTPFLSKRKDVVIRKIHFPESGARFSFNSPEEQIEHFERMSIYKFNHVVLTEDSATFTTCGTPHIEIYGPDKQLIATDECGEKNIKEGLAFINNWIKAELN